MLEHPHEHKRKNRSVPLLSLCLDDTSIVVARGRRFDEHIDSKALNALRDSRQGCILLCPGEGAVSLREALQLFNEKSGGSPVETINIVALDATWKFAREMDNHNIKNGLYPDHMLRVSLKPTDLEEFKRPSDFVQLRFEIRTPPSPDHLSTAESIAWVLSAVEQEPDLYSVLVKPLDVMVKKWQSCYVGVKGVSEAKQTAEKSESRTKRDLEPASVPSGQQGDESKRKKSNW